MISSDRYIRQLPLLGIEGQRRLSNSSALVVGLGGLGSLASMYLAGAGVGRLILVDFDTVSISDLHRQLLYTTRDIGKSKVEVAERRLREINPEVKIEAHQTVLTKNEEAEELVASVDVIVLAVDNMKTRVDVDELAAKYSKPIVNGGVDGWFGLVTTVVPGKTPRLAEILNIRGLNPVSCVEGLCNAVIGPTVGVVASWQALDALRILAGLEPTLAGKLLVIDSSKGMIEIIPISSP
ncbi:HesA/MoeB/ThiF family protein [Caldivirga maquilingensis]|uniref:UBA/THIF-type NAD/FAD binding protein n=1 Tax=Caldivirga maquilingensis (strain ATCC 700844 / DSM 13496 / JCM 10307 / IC-167) TaxID=397948 RepID=A8MBF1_CALMQ|nr:HesA/MoeB/ThiF family protein [Caldivirga maquilingensis]ABW02684.1 UBA/THIF-type NAD/FAD binding protein [Caldivirga maquilingensis IC-167]